MTTKTQSTEDEYIRKIETIKKLYAKDLLVDGEIPSKEAAVLVYERIKAQLRTNTVKKYRVIIRWYMAKKGVSFHRAEMSLDEEKYVSNKAKTYPYEARQKVLEILESFTWPNGSAVEFLRAHLQLGPILGYRLEELKFSMVEGVSSGIVDIKIKNGKNSNGRSNGEYRTLTVPRKHNDLDVAEQFIKLVELSKIQGVVDSARRLHNILRDEIPKQLIPKEKSLCLTSTRHEFVLSSREACESESLSASMGHKSAETQRINYGRNGLGSGSRNQDEIEYISKIQVDPANVKVVRDWVTNNEKQLNKLSRMKKRLGKSDNNQTRKLNARR